MPIEIHGKEYYTVVERLQMMNEKTNGDYSIKTDLLKFDGSVVIIKATLSFGGNEYTGIAMEEMSASHINKTSFVEVAETSAIGRSLASASFHGGGEFCSANELEVALDKQENKPAPKPISEDTNPITGGASDIITFGKHKGKNWSDVDEDYIEWVANNSNVDWQRDQAKSVLDDRKPRQVGGVSDSDAFEEHEKAEIDADIAKADSEKIPF